jgi:hypothetical protein
VQEVMEGQRQASFEYYHINFDSNIQYKESTSRQVNGFGKKDATTLRNTTTDTRVHKSSNQTDLKERTKFVHKSVNLAYNRSTQRIQVRHQQQTTNPRPSLPYLTVNPQNHPQQNPPPFALPLKGFTVHPPRNTPLGAFRTPL